MFTLKYRLHSNKAHFYQFMDSQGINKSVDLETAVFTSQPKGWGLYSPDDFPKFSNEELGQMQNLNYRELAFTILNRFSSFW